MKAWWRRVRPRILPVPIYGLVRLLGLTIRLDIEGYEEARKLEGSKIYAGWHGKTFFGALLFRGRGVWTIISQSRDGEMQDGIFRRFGFNTIRGSSGRGGLEALAACVKVLKTGVEMAFTPDGPRGPSGVVQPGILLMAQKSGAWIVPVGVSARRRWLVRSWDRYMVPKPFTRGIMIFGAPIKVESKIPAEEFERIRLEFEQEIHRLEQEAERRMGHLS